LSFATPSLTVRPWTGCWQQEASSTATITPYGSTTLARRSHSGFIVYTANHFIEIRTHAELSPPEEQVPSAVEMIAYFDGLSLSHGTCDWTQEGRRLVGMHTITHAMNPARIGCCFERSMSCESELGGGMLQDVSDQAGMTWKQLGGKGRTPLAGAWESISEFGHWIYLVTQGHYAVMNVADDLSQYKEGAEFTAEQKVELFQKTGGNIGARIETSDTFDHWPFVSQIPGYEIRKHETFRITSIEKDRFSASIPPHFPAGEWARMSGDDNETSP